MFFQYKNFPKINSRHVESIECLDRTNKIMDRETYSITFSMVMGKPKKWFFVTNKEERDKVYNELANKTVCTCWMGKFE